ncbi:topless-related protein 1-like [Salvia splendens]|uniref:topless-related protein 1-like n=1 Tax=Salvia splendens TaxID=180675 RepID=UPI0011009C6F|nr:topless-related protein 1-like [Salvia splendens]
MASLGKDLTFLIMQFCDEENLKKTARMLEQESGYFFNTKYFEELVLDGNWEEAEKYLSSFTVIKDNKYSTKIYFEIRKQKYLEALDKHEFHTAIDILKKDLKVFAQSNEELYKEMARLLALDDLRENDSLALYGDALTARNGLLGDLRAVIEANPLLQGKTRFPQIDKSRLRRLINQSLNWQHMLCTRPLWNPHIDTLFTDHRCPGSDNMQAQLSSLPPSPVAVEWPLSGDSSTDSLVTIDQVTAALAEEGRLYADVKSTEHINEGEGSQTDISTCCQASRKELPIEFPSTVERVLDMGSIMTSMDFHPVHEALLLVGKLSGDVEIWDVAGYKKLFSRAFVVNLLTEKVDKNHAIAVNRVLWSPDGCLFGVAYSKNELHLYDKNGSSFDKKFEIDAHIGSVNDLAFSKPNKMLVIISCGDDKLIKVWDAATGAKLYTFEGNKDPVYSLFPGLKRDIHFLFSISISGEIKVWLFDNKGSRVAYCAPGSCCTRMACGNKRLFLCGTEENGESYLVEWDENEGNIVRNYQSLSKRSSTVVQFNTCLDRFLAAGDEHVIKIWDMDSDKLLAVIDADGGLQARPDICFSKKGNLLAVSAVDNRIKILANDSGRRFLQEAAFDFGDSAKRVTESFSNLSVGSSPFPCQGVAGGNGTMATNVFKIVEVSRCQSMLLTSGVKTNLIRRLVYTHTGNGILALAEDGTHLLWRWAKSGKATMKCAPQLWQPRSGLLMTNDLPDKSGDVVTPCLSLSKNDSYIVSSSGRMISLYNLVAFKKMRNVMPSPPAATCLLFYPPDNNIIAIGMDDSTILIYNMRVDERISKLEGHSKQISGMAFSTNLNVLVSCGVDTQIVLWDSITWEKKKSTVLQVSVGWVTYDLSETNVELDKDQQHFLAVHETQLAIYETATLRRVKQWTITTFCTRISHATYSCDSRMVYAAMRDGIVLILSAVDLVPRIEIDSSAYLPPQLSCYVDPVVVASHPHKPEQFVLGLSNGGVVVIEPEESHGQWTIKNHLES